MARKTKRRPERLYGSVISWEGWTFRVLSTAIGVRWLALEDRTFDALGDELNARILADDIVNEPALDQLHEYLAGERERFTVPLDLRGTTFQLAVWEQLRQIPYGSTASYGELAQAIARPRAARAVGQALAANPVPILVPCHRVVGIDGHLVGFGGGLPLKERLLALERGSLSL
jgi:O-6-methylguanine DNA methyltransferase